MSTTSIVGADQLSLREIVGPRGLISDGDWIESKDQDPNGDVRIIQLADIGVGRYVNKSKRFMTAEATRRLNCTFLVPGDLLLARMPDPIGRTCIFPGESIPCVTAVDVCIIRPDKSLVEPRWLCHRLNSPDFLGRVNREANGTTRQRIPTSWLKSAQFELPPLEEQRRIAAILDKADALRQKRRLALQKLDSLTQSIFLDMFGDFATNPKGWKDIELGHASEVQGGLQVTPKRRAFLCQVPYLRVANVMRDSLKLDEIKMLGVTDAELKRTRLIAGDILFVEGHGNPNEIGRCAVWDGSIADCTHQNHLIRSRVNRDVLTPQFASVFFNSAFGRRQLLSAGKTTSGLNTITTSDIKRTVLPCPPIDLQVRFSNICAGIAGLQNKYRDLLLRADRTLVVFQHRAYRGEL